MEFQDLGLIDYQKALALQEDLVEQRAKNIISDQILFCTHPPVVTLGRSTQPGDITGWRGDVFEVRRGGRATYHGPSQLVIYPIISLDQKDFKNLKSKDVMSFLTSFEQAVLQSFSEMGFEGMYLKEDTEIDSEGRKLLNRGLWWNSKKIAAFGIAVRRWVTYHGCAINLYKDDQAFQGIQPCGYKPSDVGSLQEIKEFDLSALKQNLQKQIQSYLA
jgi:lipoyl(octanoyl) transferase